VSKIRPNRKKQSRGGGPTYAALAILAVVILAVIGYLLLTPHKRPFRPRPAPSVAGKESRPRVSRPGQRAELPAPPRDAPETLPAIPPSVSPETPVKPPLKPEYPAEPPSEAENAPLPAVVPGGKGRLAIIIDDMGAGMREARSLAAIGVPLTFAIIPGLHSCREVAAFAAGNGIETMIHLPMQSKGWPQQRLESNGLLVSMAEADIRDRMEGFARDVPHAVGANNHMGSEFTEHEPQMSSVLGVLKGRGLFFIDSVTTPRSVGQRLAREMGVRSGRRSVFLDNEQNGAYIRGQLNLAVRQARKNGGAIAICHPHPATIATLAAALPTLQQQGVTLVPASRLVR
jgi:polysaccharide deacetylase 2 family uncharacterized protein YibQ